MPAESIKFDKSVYSKIIKYKKDNLLFNSDISKILKVSNNTLRLASKRWVISVKIYRRIKQFLEQTKNTPK